VEEWLEEESSKGEEQDDQTGMDAGFYVLEGVDGHEQVQGEGTVSSEQVVVGDNESLEPTSSVAELMRANNPVMVPDQVEALRERTIAIIDKLVGKVREFKLSP